MRNNPTKVLDQYNEEILEVVRIISNILHEFKDLEDIEIATTHIVKAIKTIEKFTKTCLKIELAKQKKS